MTGQTPYVSRIGGSVPVLDYFQRRPGVYSIVFEFIRDDEGFDDEGFHAPNEFLRLENFRCGPFATAVFLERLARLGPASLRVVAAPAGSVAVGSGAALPERDPQARRRARARR